MSRDTSYWMLWDCSDCGLQGIPCSPRHRSCPECDHTRTFVEFDNAYLPGDDESWDEWNHEERAFTPEEEARFGDLGASWFCTNCQADNYADERECHHCHASRGASDDDLRDALDYETFQAYMDGDQGVSAFLVEQFGEYAGMRAAQGLSFDMDDAHADQLERAQEGRSAFKAEMKEETHEARPEWDDTDLPSSVEYDAQNADAQNADAQETEAHEAPEDPPEMKIPRIEPVAPKSTPQVRYIPHRVMFVLFWGGMISGLILFLRWGCTSHEVEGSVEAMRWERTLYVERWENVYKEDWQENIREVSEVPPTKGTGERAGVYIVSCSPKHHHNEQYVCGQREVACRHMKTVVTEEPCKKRVRHEKAKPCKKPTWETKMVSCRKAERVACGEKCSTKRKSNGSAKRSCVTTYCTKMVDSTCRKRVRTWENTTCTDITYTMEDAICTKSRQEPIHDHDVVDRMCERSVTRPWCQYKTQRWASAGTYNLSGTNEPRWPEASPGVHERTRTKGSYYVTLGYDRDPKSHAPERGYSREFEVSLETYEQWKAGDPVTFSVNNFGGTDVLRGPQ